MVQENTLSQGGCNLKCVLTCSKVMTSIVCIYVQDGSPVLQLMICQAHWDRWSPNAK